jgi:hypothetical protein
MLENPDQLRELNDKVGRLWQYIDQHPYQVRNIPNWSLSALVNN